MESNGAVVEALQAGLIDAGLPAEAIQLVPGPRDVTDELMAARGLIDVLIPRGGAGLIDTVVRNSQVPVIETGVGNCHLFVDATADRQMALDILINAKVQRPSVCNAVETLLVHSDVAADFVPVALTALADHGVTVHGDERFAEYGAVVPVEDFPAQEYLSLDIAAAVVDSLDAALEHIRRYSTGHSETIVTGSQTSAARFAAEIDARAAVLVNASSRFVDGGVRLRRGDRHLHPKAPCPWTDGAAGDDLDQVRRDGNRSSPRLTQRYLAR